MPEAQDFRFGFDHDLKHVQIIAPTLSITIQEIYDAIAYHRARPLFIDDSEIARAEGKINIPGLGDSLIVLTMIEGWKVKFDDRPGPEQVLAEIVAGVLVGEGGSAPLAPAAFVTVFLAQAVSGASIQQPKIDEMHQMLGLLVGSPIFESSAGRESTAGANGKDMNQIFTPNDPVDGTIKLERDPTDVDPAI